MAGEVCGSDHGFVVGGHRDESRSLAFVGRQVANDADAVDGPERTEETPEGGVVDVRREVADVEGTAGRRSSGGQWKSRRRI